MRSSISVVVAARNCEPFLKESINSALNQSHPPLEVIYVDDGSEDESVKIVKNNFPNVKIITQPHSGIAAARNQGIKESQGEWIIFLDGDDIFPFDYLEKKYNIIQQHPDCSYVYSSAQAFGSTNFYWDVPDWIDDSIVWRSNFVNTSTLHRKTCLQSIDGWHPSIGTGEDYDLLFRLTQAGFKGVPDKQGFLLYRQHKKSTSHLQGQKQDGINFSRFLMRLKFAKTFIGCILSDRLNIFDKWLETISENVQYYIDQFKNIPPYDKFGQIVAPLPSLNIIYTGSNFLKIFPTIDQYRKYFQEVRIQYDPFINKNPTKISTMLAKNYNTMLEMNSHIAWFIEDDVVPPKHAFYNLIFNLLGGNSGSPLYAVTGVYRNRHDSSLVLHNWENEIKYFHELNEINDFVDIAGTGCLMIFRPYASHKFKPFFKEENAHDWYWCMKLKEDCVPFHPRIKKIYVEKNVTCKHFVDNEKWLEV